MKFIRSVLVVLVAATLGVWAGIAFGADAPNVDKPAQKVAASDRWFVLASPKNEGSGYLHITIKESGDPEAPIHVTYDCQRISKYSTPVSIKLEILCLNDEWLSPVRLVGSLTAGPDARSSTATFTRPSPQATAGKLVVVRPGRADIESEVKERTVTAFTPLEIVARMPFEENTSVKFALIEGVSDWRDHDAELSYAGQEELEIKGQKQSLHKFTQKVMDGKDLDLSYWLNDKHEIVHAETDGAVLTPATEAEARAAVKVQAPEPRE